VGGVLGYLAFINGLLAVFNLIPAFPLDGGRILRSILWKVKGNLKWATRISSQIGGGFGIFLIILGVMRFLAGNFIGGMWFFLIGLFIQNAAKMSYQQLVVRKALEGENLRRFMNAEPVTVSPDMSLQELVDDYILRHHYKMLPVVNSHQLLGCVTLKQVKQIPREEWPSTTVRDLAEHCSPENTIGPDVDAVQALAQMRRNNSSRAMVVENDRLVGVVSLKDLLEFLSLKVELEG
jgi:CBS domain-containing protein